MKRKPPIERFWPKVRVLGSAECWPWLGALRGLPGKQYGNFWYGVDGYRNIGAHCFAWILKNGPIPPGVWILHRCDFMLCCNESHLFPGDAQINNADMAAKNRNRFSERHWNCRLTDEQIEEIRIATARGEVQQVTADRFGINQSHVSRISRMKDRIKRMEQAA